jgi:DNA-binding PadR family transcriptional regulator
VLPSHKEVAVLGLLAREAELYGLQMVEASEGALKRGTVYVTLSRMEKKGYVESWLDDASPSNAPARRRYRITALGRRMLRAWRMVHSSLNAEPAT